MIQIKKRLFLLPSMSPSVGVELMCSSIIYIYIYIYRDGNFAPPRPAPPRTGFPRPAKVVGRGWGNILSPHPGAGRGWV